MTGDEWMEIVDWVNARFPHSPWHPEQAVAYFQDLNEYDPTDVWQALHGWYAQGQTYAPGGSVLVAAVRTLRRRNALDEQMRQLPEDVGEVIRWSDYAERRFGERLSWSEAIPRIHAERCRDESCGCRAEISETH